MSGFVLIHAIHVRTAGDGIYLPAGEWIDYYEGTRFTGPRTLKAYPAPLVHIPVFAKVPIRAGPFIRVKVNSRSNSPYAGAPDRRI